MLTHFLDLLAAVISVTSLLIVTYGALIGIISFLKNEIRRFTGGYSHYQYTKIKSYIRNLSASWLRISDSFGYFENSIGAHFE